MPNSHNVALKCVYQNSLSITDSLRLLESDLNGRGIVLSDMAAAWMYAAYESVANIQEAVEAVIPPEEL